ncbi:MAG: lytic transglycosylase domain-containing protein [Bacteroidetes bacterium]|nr:lytic transglycosylase domain-containing protein [Bacteroidota bacterium]MBK9800010.1 lytic transglycosylase domain-containing protein [Bacteroidota bacterium]MBP6412513.1 lytic transglycosylase domain-containing protein [Bacteroidia bacterium]
MKKHLISTVSLLVLILLLMLFTFAKKLSSDESFNDEFRNGYKVFALNIPLNLSFAGEKVPMNNFDVRESLDRELLVSTYFQSQSLLVHKRANRWFPVIEPILKKYNVPNDFKYLAVIESNLTNVISPAGATGYWQLMEAAAKKYNLEINEQVDERYNVEKSTEAACLYLLEAYKTLGNWTLAAASYNMGIEGISKQMEIQKQNNYYNLLLNQETARYIFRILAAKEILEHPKNYGYNVRKKDVYAYIPTQRLSVDTSISNLADFAISQESNYKILKIFNPWLRKNYLQNTSHKHYVVLLPKKGYTDYDYIEKHFSNDNIYSSEDSLRFYITESAPADSASSTN